MEIPRVRIDMDMKAKDGMSPLLSKGAMDNMASTGCSATPAMPSIQNPNHARGTHRVKLRTDPKCEFERNVSGIAVHVWMCSRRWVPSRYWRLTLDGLEAKPNTTSRRVSHVPADIVDICTCALGSCRACARRRVACG